MKCRILHESNNRMRIHPVQTRMTSEQADILEYYLNNLAFVAKASVSECSGNAVISYTGDRSSVVDALTAFSYAAFRDSLPEHTSRALNRAYEEKLVMKVAGRVFRKLFFPEKIHLVLVIFHSVHYITKGIRALWNGHVDVSVLDAVAITASLVRRDHDTASSIMFLLGIGEILEDWTHKKSVDDLARTMSLNVDKVWKKVGEQEELIPMTEVQEDDRVVIRTGNMIPLDGKVLSGEASVNQASMTGESLPVRKSSGSYVYAGTVVEEGQCVIAVEKTSGAGRYDRIVHMIEESEKLKSATEDKASHLADHLVPYSLLGTVLVWLLTRNANRALSFLMVDFSCALKLAMPISVLSAMREGSVNGITIKGGKHMEAVAEADTIIFDKTGTLTKATPKVAGVVTFNGRDENEMLRLSACLEEHYPHSIANAVVAEAARKELRHEEEHSEVEYVVAHGISSRIREKKVVIGSHHFVFEDEGCIVPEGEVQKFEDLPNSYSHLYLAISGVLAAVILIEDPIREEAPAVIRELRKLGIKKVVMMTGDSDRTAKAVAEKLKMDEYRSEVLPEDKAAYIRKEHQEGRRVIMVGDGVNDSPALSESDAGIAISDGAAIAREIADITISSDDLYPLITLKDLSNALMKRIYGNYRFIMGFNGSLIAAGALGFLPPATLALLHNTSTLLISLNSMTDLLKTEK